jgi:hypothetical protein
MKFEPFMEIWKMYGNLKYFYIYWNLKYFTIDDNITVYSTTPVVKLAVQKLSIYNSRGSADYTIVL